MARDNETKEQRDARMAWWREARFGLFIHWGVYSVPAGFYHGNAAPGIGEWIMANCQIPVAEYKQFAKKFTASRFDADFWVRLAKEAGMKYIIITSKHHDGFGMFDSKVTDWDIVDATPFKRDPLKELADACRKHGLKLGFYYSQAQDWCHKGGAGNHWDETHDGSMDEYIRTIAVPQVRELLSNYGDVAVLWWDTPVDMTEERAKQFLPVLELQPNLITNDRIGGGVKGDTESPEQYIPNNGYDRDWETCMTMNNTWGFRSDDEYWKDAKTLIQNLAEIASKGGNYLLNVGPTSEGEIPEACVERLRAIGQWMKVNGESIYGTTASPFPRRLLWGCCTSKVREDGSTLYLHVFDWPADGQILLPGLKNSVASARLLADPKQEALKTEQTGDGVVVHVPAETPDPDNSVVVLELTGTLDIETILPGQGEDAGICLKAVDATCRGHLITWYDRGDDYGAIGYWRDPGDFVEWQFTVTKPGKFAVCMSVGSVTGGSFKITVGDTTLTAVTPVTGDYEKFVEVSLGSIEIAEPGTVTLTVRAVPEGWNPLNLQYVRLDPA